MTDKPQMNSHDCGCVTYYDPLADGYEYAEVCDGHWAAKYNVDYDPDISPEANLKCANNHELAERFANQERTRQGAIDEIADELT